MLFEPRLQPHTHLRFEPRTVVSFATFPEVSRPREDRATGFRGNLPDGDQECVEPPFEVSGYDFFGPIVSGVDVSSLAAKVPSWAWPLILLSITGLFQFLRNLADKRHTAELAEARPGEGG